MQARVTSLLIRRQPLSVIISTLSMLLILSISLNAESTQQRSLLSLTEYALIENDTATARLILQYMNDHPDSDQEKHYSQLRLASICQEDVLMKFAHQAKGDRDLFWQLISAKKPLLTKNALLDKRSHNRKEDDLERTPFSLNAIFQYSWQDYPPFLKNLYQEALVFQRDFLSANPISPSVQRLTSLLLKATIDYFFHSKQPCSLFSFYTDYNKGMTWLKLNQIKADFLLEQLGACPGRFIEQQLVETYDVFFYLQTNLLHKGLLNEKRKESMRKQFAVEEKAIFFYEDLYRQTENPYWLQKILKVTENIRSSLLITRQPYYLSDGLLRDLGRSLLAEVEKKSVLSPGDSLYLIHQQDALSQHYQSFYIVHQLRKKKEGKPGVPSLKAIRKVMKEKGGSLLNFFDTKDYFFALFVSEEGELWQTIPKTDSLHTSLQYLREVCSTPEGIMEADKRMIRKIQQVGYSVYKKLLTPFFGKTIPSKLIIIPDGSLNYLSFETLFTQDANTTEGLSYLVQHSTIRYYPGLRLLLEYEQAEPLLVNQLHTYSANYPMLISATTDRKGWGALPGGAEEVCAIATHFPTQTISQNSIDFIQNATPSGSNGLLHLAMHAATRFEDREEPGLVFSDAPNDILFLHEIAGYPHRYPVVVLSACETGLGKTIAGEGVKSIGQQFLQTGSRSTIQSLSKVADASSSRLMAGWYAALANKQASDYALRQSKLQFLDQGDPFYQHPYFWGSFVAYGQAFHVQPTN